MIRDLSRQADRLLREVTVNDSSLNSMIDTLFTYSVFQPSQKKSELKEIFRIVETSKPLNICEVGTYRGGSLFVICQAAPENARIISIDINYPIARKLAFKKFAKPGQHLTPLKGSTLDLVTEEKVKRLLRGEQLDFLFIDGDHSLFGVMNDYVRLSPLVREGGLIVFHDINPDQFIKTGVKSSSFVGGVPDFWKLLSNQDVSSEQFIEDPEQDGFGLGLMVKGNGRITK